MKTKTLDTNSNQKKLRNKSKTNKGHHQGKRNAHKTAAAKRLKTEASQTSTMKTFKDCIPIKMWLALECNKKLRSICIRTTISHRKKTRSIMS